MATFESYKEAPWFWFWIAIIIAAEVSENPFISAKYSRYQRYPLDMDGILTESMKRYQDIYGKRKERFKYDW